MSNFLINVLILFIPGLINSTQSAYILIRNNTKIKGLPFFKPIKSRGFWLWLSIQMLLPALGFYALFYSEFNDFYHQISAHNPAPLFKSTTFGILFVGIVNSSTYFGPLKINIKSIYDIFVRLALYMIEKEQNQINSRFWEDFRIELSTKSPKEIVKGLNGLSFYIHSLPKRRLMSNKLEKSYLYQDEELDTNEFLLKINDYKMRINNMTSNVFLSKNIQIDTYKLIDMVRGNVFPDDLAEILTKFSCRNTLESYLHILNLI